MIHVAGRVDPVDDADVINFELALADVAQIERRLERLKKGRVKAVEEQKRNDAEGAALALVMEALERGAPARSVELNEEAAELVRGLQLLTAKPMVYAANVAEGDLADPDSNVHVAALKKRAKEEGADVVVVSAQVEAELRELEAAEAAEYLAGLGAAEGGLGALVSVGGGLGGSGLWFRFRTDLERSHRVPPPPRRARASSL